MKAEINLEELDALLAGATSGLWQHHCSHVYGPDPERTLICQFINGPWLVSDRNLIVFLRNHATAIRSLIAREKVMREALGVAAEELEYFVEFAVRQQEFEGDGDAGFAALKQARAALSTTNPETSDAD